MKKTNGKTHLIFLLSLGIFIASLSLVLAQQKKPQQALAVIDYPKNQREDTTEPELLDPPKTIYCGDFPCYDAQEFIALFDHFEDDQNLTLADTTIYGQAEVDSYIQQLAQERGYQKHGLADEKKLVWFENVQTYPAVRDAYISMRNELLKHKVRLHLVSGYRSANHQQNIFTKKMKGLDPAAITKGSYDEKINDILTVSSIPGYSKHHTGYAVDFGCGNNYLVYSFSDTPCYKWLSENNFEHAKKYGFIPSYPFDVRFQGPNPEPWEFVWVGSDYIKNPTKFL